MGSACSGDSTRSSDKYQQQQSASEQHAQGTAVASKNSHNNSSAPPLSSFEASTLATAESSPVTTNASAMNSNNNGATTTTTTTTTVAETPGPPEKRKLEPAQIQKLIVTTLKQSVLGECLTVPQLQQLAQESDLRKWSKIGDVICQQNDKCEYIYVVLKGEVLLEVNDSALDTRPNQLQIARVLAEQNLVPLTDEQGNPNHSTKRSGGAPPNSMAISTRAGNNSTLTAGGGGMTRTHGNNRGSRVFGSTLGHSRNVPLTKAEAAAMEAAQLIEAENQISPSNKHISANRKSGQFSNESPVSDGNNQFHSFDVTQFQNPNASQNPEDADAIEKNLLRIVPERYTANKNSMFMSCKTATQCFGVGLFFAHGKFMYSGINNALSTHLIMIPKKAFENLWSKNLEVKQILLHHLGEYLENCLASSRWLCNPQIVPPHKLTLLTSLFHHATIPSNTMLFEEGDICSDDSPLYFIMSGSVELTFTNEKGHKHTKVLSKGALFGELGVLLGFSVTASAMTLEPCIFRLCKRRWMNLFCMMVPQLVPTLRSNVTKNYHVRDEQLLENEHIQTQFTEFCLSLYNAENIEFYSRAIHFRKIFYPNHAHLVDEVLNEAAAIYNRFISETAVLQINIKQAVRQNIKDTIQTGDITKELFFAAEREICTLMLQDSFLRFKQTPAFHEALTKLCAPPPAPILLNHSNTTAYHQHQIRAKEYSRTDQPALGAETTEVTATQRVPLRRKLSLDDNDDSFDPTAHVPLMFGGGKRGSAFGSGLNVPGGSQGGLGVSNDAGNGTPNTGASRHGASRSVSQQQQNAPSKSHHLTIQTQPNTLKIHTPSQANQEMDLNPLGTPPLGPTASPNSLLLPPSSVTSVGLTLSPSTDKFRVRNTDGSMSSPMQRAQTIDKEKAKNVNFDLDQPETLGALGGGALGAETPRDEPKIDETTLLNRRLAGSHEDSTGSVEAKGTPPSAPKRSLKSLHVDDTATNNTVGTV